MDFLKLMGKGKRCWKHVKHVEQIIAFQTLFEKNRREAGDRLLIPEILHVVWLGDRPYPETSKRYLEGWKRMHPTWQVHVWTEENIALGEYRDLYERSNNWGEKSDLVRLIVLEKMGGLYVDHDMECRQSFAPLHRTYPFYGGLLTPGNPVIDRSAIVRNSIIGVEPHSPIIRLALEKLRERWDAIGKEYPGEDVQSIKKRVTLRSFAPFHESVLEAIEDPEFKGIIFPAGCFNEIERSYGLFAKEDMVGAWYTEPMTHHEEYLNNRLHKLMKRMHLFMAGVCVLMVLSLGAKPLYRYCVKQARKTSSYQPCAVVEGEKPFVIVIPSYNNARYVDRNLQSVFAQEYTNYRVVYIDDASSDGTHEKALAYPVTLIRNAENQKALANLYQVIHGLRDEEIVVLLDGDDWLFHTKVLQTLNRYYQDSKVWLTYGQYITYPQGEKGISREPLTRWRTRSEGWFGKETDWCFSHLRTFYAGLFKKIKRSDLEYQGEFFSSAWDLAMLFPMVEMAGDHAVYVPDILYVYNQETTLSDGKVHKEEQLFFNRYIRSLPVYPRIRDGLGIHP